MSRVQLALNVANLDQAVAFYSSLFATEPAKVRPGYANFAIDEPPLKLVLIEGVGAPGSVNHLGVEVHDADAVASAHRRLEGEGMACATEDQVSCCFAVQDKVWVDAPDGEAWEIYTVLADTEHPAGEFCAVEPARPGDPAGQAVRCAPAVGADAEPAASAPAGAGLLLTATVPTVLFVCVHNAGRSQMALGWFQHLAGGAARAWSGGSAPGAEVNPAAVAAMAEVGIDIAPARPGPWTDEMLATADVVVTMGCGDACPVRPGARHEDWPVDDPAGQGVDAVRPIRDDIGRRVERLLSTLGVPDPAADAGSAQSAAPPSAAPASSA